MENKIPSAMILPGLKTPEEIAAEIWGITHDRLFERTRKREVVEARMVLISYRRRNLKLTQAAASNKYGLRQHGSTIHSCETVDILVETNKEFKEKFDLFNKKVI